MKEISGDLLKLAKLGKFDVIVHGCNCQGVMGKGIAKQIKEQFHYNFECDEMGEIPGTIKECYYHEYDLLVVNAYTQVHYINVESTHHNHKGLKDDAEARYGYIKKCLNYINKHHKGERIGLPLIGCGLAGGNWSVVKKIIEEELKDCDVTIVHYDKGDKRNEYEKNY